MDGMKAVFLEIIKHRPYSEEGQFLQEKVVMRTYNKGQVLFYQWDEVNWVYMTHQGLIVLNRYNAQGSLYYHDFVLPNVFFPLTNIFGESHYEYEAVALTKVETWQMKRSDFVEFLRRFPQYYPELYQDLVKVNARLEERLHFMMTANAKERILKILRNLVDDYGYQEDGWYILPWPITITEIAQISGTTRETASATINHLRRNREIRYEHKQLSLPI